MGKHIIYGENLKWVFMRLDSIELCDHGGSPYVLNVEQMAMRNQNFRTAVWTGNYLQMTLMCIPPGGEIGIEMHHDTDQFIRIERGNAVVKMGRCKEEMASCRRVCIGDAIFVPAGTWHNIINSGSCLLKVSSIYAPPHHPKGTVHVTKEDAAREEC